MRCLGKLWLSLLVAFCDCLTPPRAASAKGLVPQVQLYPNASEDVRPVSQASPWAADINGLAATRLLSASPQVLPDVLQLQLLCTNPGSLNDFNDTAVIDTMLQLISGVATPQAIALTKDTVGSTIMPAVVGYEPPPDIKYTNIAVPEPARLTIRMKFANVDLANRTNAFLLAPHLGGLIDADNATHIFGFQVLSQPLITKGSALTPHPPPSPPAPPPSPPPPPLPPDWWAEHVFHDDPMCGFVGCRALAAAGCIAGTIICCICLVISCDTCVPRYFERYQK